MSRRLDDLSDRFRPLAVELLARAAEAGIAVMIIDTLRTPAEQEENIRRGVSWTSNSKHLPQFAGGGKAEAIDICPYSVFQLHGPDKLQWSADDPVWNTLGKIGEELGMRWGGRWIKQDMGHFERPPSWAV